MSQPRLLAFSGSARTDSVNQKTVQLAATGARAAGAEVTVVNLDDYPMPLYHGDLEAAEGLPENAAKLQALFAEHDGLLIASPEYNGSVTALMKNTLDWISRVPDEAADPYEGKVAAIMSASPGGLGGMRGLVHLRAILSNLGILVLPGQVSVSKAFQAFDESGALTDERRRGQLEALGAELASTVAKLKA